MIPDEQYLELVAYLNDELTSAETEDLLRRIKGEPALAAQLLAIAEDEGRIVEWARLRQQNDTVSDYVIQPGPRPQRQSRTPSISKWSTLWQSALVVAASIAFVAAISYAVLTASIRPRAGEDDQRVVNAGQSKSPILARQEISQEPYFLSDTQEVIARVVSVTTDVKWAKNHRPSDFLMRFRPGDIVGLKAGRAQIEFSSGAMLVLNSPSLLQVTSTTSARLLRGTLVGRADSGVDFTIVTPSATVVDIGTEFGVGVSKAGTDVNVFDGEVHVHGLWSTEAVGSSVRKLEAGMSVRVDPDGFHQTLPTRVFEDLNGGREFLNPTSAGLTSDSISLLDLIAGKSQSQRAVAGSIDATTGYWGRPPGFGTDLWNKTIERRDQPFVLSDWNEFVDGVFIPGSEAGEYQIDSAGHVIELPLSTGTSWGPIWSRRRSGLDYEQPVTAWSEHDYWGFGSLEAVTQRLVKSRDGLLGLHANVGITFDLDAIRRSLADRATILRFSGLLANLDNSAGQDPTQVASQVDVRILVDGELRFSRLEFGRHDGEETLMIPFNNEDRFLTIVSTDADGSINYDHAVLIDPVLQVQRRSTRRN